MLGILIIKPNLDKQWEEVFEILTNQLIPN